MASDSFYAMLNILITRYGVELGILEWDAKAGRFAGFAHAEVEACAQHPQLHPAFPGYDGIPATDPVALAILLHALGWDVPEVLREPLTVWLSGFPEVPVDVIF